MTKIKRSARTKEIPATTMADTLAAVSKTEDMDEIIEFTKHADPKVRVAALKQICPCRVLANVDKFWKRVFEMLHDEDEAVRAQVLHTLCDGSPLELEDSIIAALKEFDSEPNKETRRRAHKVLGHYARTGSWNIL